MLFRSISRCRSCTPERPETYSPHGWQGLESTPSSDLSPLSDSPNPHILLLLSHFPLSISFDLTCMYLSKLLLLSHLMSSCSSKSPPRPPARSSSCTMSNITIINIGSGVGPTVESSVSQSTRNSEDYSKFLWTLGTYHLRHCNVYPRVTARSPLLHQSEHFSHIHPGFRCRCHQVLHCRDSDAQEH